MTRKRTLTLLPAAALVAALAAAPAAAGAGSHGAKANAAAKKKSRTSLSKELRRARQRAQALDGRLAKLEKQVAALTGTPGPAGSPGPAGPQGPQGPQGNPFDEPIFHLGSVKRDPTGSPNGRGTVLSSCPGDNQAAITGWGYSDTGAINLMVGYDTTFPDGSPRIGQFRVDGIGSNIYGMAICVDSSLVEWPAFVQP